MTLIYTFPSSRDVEKSEVAAADAMVLLAGTEVLTRRYDFKHCPRE